MITITLLLNIALGICNAIADLFLLLIGAIIKGIVEKISGN